MRFIDADEFKKQIAGMAIVNNYPADKANKICELIDCQPTAYDVDKAVELLEERKKLLLKDYVLIDKADEVKERTIARINEIDGLIDIVKSGVIK